MKKKIDSPFRKLKVLVVLPLAAMLFYAFALPEYQYETSENNMVTEDNKVEVKGQVLKSDGTPLAGTSVILRNSTIGTITDKDGNFKLTGMPADGELFFSFVGFKTVVKKITTQPMTITMEVGKVGIEGVTVVGYGTPPPPPPPIAQIRSNIDDANPPLIFLDGIPITKAAMDQLDPETFQSISVLKDKSATAVYGERAVNGAILIITKGKAAKGTGAKSSNEEVVVVGYGKSPAGQTPQNSKVAIRSIDGENPPLIIIDGTEVDKKTLDQTEPGTIEKMEVLKDQSAIEKYGEKGKNGVIKITTKMAALKMSEASLYILDETETDKSTISQVDPKSIERMFILKDPTLLAPYGEKGKNGVILVLTKEYKLNNPQKFKDTINKMIKPTQREDGVFLVVEEMPEFPGKELALREFIAKTIKYPADALKDSIQGRVFVTFVVKSDGSVGDAKIARGVHPSLDQEALRVVSALPTWKPGKQRGVAVNVSYTIPVQFSLKGDKNDQQALFFPPSPKVPMQRPDGVFIVVEEMPEFPGGEMALREFIAKTVEYPADALKDSIQGKVYVTFVVKADGSIGDSKVARGVHPSLDKEAVRVVYALPKWKPGKQGGNAVDVSYTVPIQFALQGKNVKQTVSFTPPKDHQKGGKEVFVVVEEMPEFPGGSQALRSFVAKSIRYPAEAQKEKVQGKVYVSFVVSTSGKVENARIDRSVSPTLDAEAIRVVSQMPDWKPGKQRGKAVSVEYTIPIEFKLQ